MTSSLQKLFEAFTVLLCGQHVQVGAFSFSRYHTAAHINKSTENSLRIKFRRYSSFTTSVSVTVVPMGESYSTLTLLEHIHLLTPDIHEHGDDCIGNEINSKVDFFVNAMGLSLDPKSCDNIEAKSGVVVVNCGASQLHLNDDISFFRRMERNSASSHPAFEVGLRYNKLSLLKSALSKGGKSCSYDESADAETIRIKDACGNTFVATESKSNNEVMNTNEPTIASLLHRKSNAFTDDIAAPKTNPLCEGINYVEYFVPVRRDDDGKTVEKIARFYDFFFDAPTTVVHDGTSHVAIIGFGKIEVNGRAEQSLLFRERLCDSPPAAYVSECDEDIGSGHHIAIYVGANDEDFEVAASNCVEGDLLWVNSRFEDRVLDVGSAMHNKQFRFKDIIDIETGDVVFVLEHEVRSVTSTLSDKT